MLAVEKGVKKKTAKAAKKAKKKEKKKKQRQGATGDDLNLQSGGSRGGCARLSSALDVLAQMEEQQEDFREQALSTGRRFTGRVEQEALARQNETHVLTQNQLPRPTPEEREGR